MYSVSKTYSRLVIVMGLTLLLQQMRLWQTTDVLQYLSYSILAVLAALFQVGYRTEQGVVPLNLLFVLISLRSLSPSETMLLAVASAAAGEWPGSKWTRQRVSDCIFAVSVMAIAVGLADYAMRGVFVPASQKQLNDALTAILAGVTFFVGVSFPSATREALEAGLKMRVVWKERYFWMMPYYAAGAVLASIFDRAKTELGGWQIPSLAIPVTYLLYRSYRIYMGRLEDGRSHAEEMASLHLRTIEALALAIDAKDQTTHDHLQRVQVYAMEVGTELGMAGDDLEALRAASLLHDIGKLAVPEHIISKPGRLTPEEFDKMKIHPVVGAEILERVKFPYPVAPMVRSHHEKWDGTGYPDGLRGERIPLGARILSAVDCLDALASDRQYRKALPLDQAIGVVVQEAGKAFDPRVVEILARRYVELERLATAHAVEPLKLSKDLRIEAGAAPAAGYEGSSEPASKRTATGEQPEFLSQIAAARQEAQALFELAQNLGSSLSLDETLSVLSVRLKRIVPFDSMAVYIKREDRLLPEFVSGDNFRLFSALEIPMGQGLSGWVAENSKPILNGNPSVEPGYMNDPSKFSTLRSAVAVPLVGVNGVVGVLALYHGERDAFNKDHLRVLLVVSSKLSLAVENALRYRQAETSATTDFLTGLPNARSLFLHLDGEIARSKRSSEPLTLLVCDLDNFKQINDQYGHLEGNKVLKVVGKALRDNCREYDYVARMGGDEFVMVLPGLEGPAAEQRMEHLRRITLEEARLQTGLELSISIGAACYPVDGNDAEDLLSGADRLMYKAKELSPARLKAQRNWALWQQQLERPTSVQ
ncbi:MAG: diguanylate cyclase [Candidatus Solibacter usitatus]|nr:diguanylate cyclase [Candidatus Solibacter usitatus]